MASKRIVFTHTQHVCTLHTFGKLSFICAECIYFKLYAHRYRYRHRNIYHMNVLLQYVHWLILCDRIKFESVAIFECHNFQFSIDSNRFQAKTHYHNVHDAFYYYLISWHYFNSFVVCVCVFFIFFLFSFICCCYVVMFFVQNHFYYSIEFKRNFQLILYIKSVNAYHQQ